MISVLGPSDKKEEGLKGADAVYSGRLKFWAWTLQARSRAWEGTGTAAQSQVRAWKSPSTGLYSYSVHTPLTPWLDVIEHMVKSRRARHILGFVLKRDGKPEDKLSSSGNWALSIAWHRSLQHVGEFAVQVEVLGYQPGEIIVCTYTSDFFQPLGHGLNKDPETAISRHIRLRARVKKKERKKKGKKSRGAGLAVPFEPVATHFPKRGLNKH
ncbi:hypothetical protein L209DRAFT_468844 [Thermothelomyces heterothallicus CBS 203.75]